MSETSAPRAVIRAEESSDQIAIRQLHESAFGQALEAQLVDELRAGRFVTVSLVAELEGQIVGHVLFSPLTIQNEVGSTAALALAPLAVSPRFQRQGIAHRLVSEGLNLLKQSGHRIVIVLGDPHYYGRFGFENKLTEYLVSPYAGPYFLGLELVPNALAGVNGRVVYAAPFDALE